MYHFILKSIIVASCRLPHAPMGYLTGSPWNIIGANYYDHIYKENVCYKIMIWLAGDISRYPTSDGITFHKKASTLSRPFVCFGPFLNASSPDHVILLFFFLLINQSCYNDFDLLLFWLARRIKFNKILTVHYFFHFSWKIETHGH